MPVDYAIGVGTFVPNNAIIFHQEATELMTRLMNEKGIKHTTSECTLRGFTCAQVNVDPKVATPAEIAKMRAIQTGHQVDGITGGTGVKRRKRIRTARTSRAIIALLLCSPSASRSSAEGHTGRILQARWRSLERDS